MAKKDYSDLIDDQFNDTWVNNWKLVDTLPILSYINKYKNLEDLQDALQERYVDILPEELEGSLFCYISQEEFAIYLKRKYGVHYKETLIEHIKYIRGELEDA